MVLGSRRGFQVKENKHIYYCVPPWQVPITEFFVDKRKAHRFARKMRKVTHYRVKKATKGFKERLKRIYYEQGFEWYRALLDKQGALRDVIHDQGR
jgi:hypothetical protein